MCPNLKKWGPPPGPASFLACGLPKTEASGSLPRDLSTVDIGPLQHVSSYQSGGKSSALRWTNSMPSPTWESEGHDGSICQVLSVDGENGESDEAKVTAVNSVQVGKFSVAGGADNVHVAGKKTETLGGGSRPRDAQNSEIDLTCYIPRRGQQLASAVQRIPAELSPIDAKQVRHIGAHTWMCSNGMCRDITRTSCLWGGSSSRGTGSVSESRIRYCKILYQSSPD